MMMETVPCSDDTTYPVRAEGFLATVSRVLEVAYNCYVARIEESDSFLLLHRTTTKLL